MIRPALAFPVGFALCASLASAQVRQPGTPVAREIALNPDVPTLAVPQPNIPALRAEDRFHEENNVPVPLRFGAPMVVDVDSQSAGRWDVAENGDLVWRLHVSSPGAYSLGLEFSNYRLAEGASLFLYSPDMDTVFGAYTSYHNQHHGEFGIEPFPGDELVLELRQPAGVEDSDVVLHRVIHDYRDIFEMERRLDELETHSGDGADGGCSVNANCPEGDGKDHLKRATVRTVFGGGLCSGMLINNTAFDGEQLLYTANHCGQGGSTVVRFNYQTANCNGGSAPTGQQVSGCTVLAADVDSDGRLLRINNNIPASYNPFYAGWTRQTNGMTFGIGFHHPGGAPKNVAVDSNGGGQGTANFFGIGLVYVWNLNFQVGGTIGGSSGSPIFDQNDRIRGTLTGGPSNCAVSYYGRLNRFWNDNSTVRNTLDPLGTAPTFIDGFDPSNPGGGGGGGTESVINSVSPASVPVVSANPVTVTLTGTGFTGATKLTVAGQELSVFPPEWAIVNDTTITFTLPQLPGIGSYPIEVEDPDGNGNSSIVASANLTPTIDLVNSNPAFLLSALGAEVHMGSLPNDVMFLLVSPNLGVTAVPGLFTASIGGGDFGSLILIGTFNVGAQAYATVTAPFSLPTGFGIHFQALNLSSILPTLPLSGSNVESGTVLF